MGNEIILHNMKHAFFLYLFCDNFNFYGWPQKTTKHEVLIIKNHGL
jgi:hypothetical protein